jgi:hypothetical protein
MGKPHPSSNLNLLAAVQQQLRKPQLAVIQDKTEDVKGEDAVHYHEFTLAIWIDPKGKLVVDGATTSTSDGPPHTHILLSRIEDLDETEHEFDSGGPSHKQDEHVHLVRLKFKAPGPELIAEGASQEQLRARARARPALPGELIRSAVWKLSQQPQSGMGQIVYCDGSGHVGFQEGIDPRRLFSQSQMAFRTPILDQGLIAETETKLDDLPIPMDENGYLPMELYRTGKFVHPEYDKIEVELRNLDRMAENFERGILPQMVIINRAHKKDRGGLGVVKKIDIRTKEFQYVNPQREVETNSGHSIWGFFDLNRPGKREILEDKEWFYVSTESVKDFRQPEYKGERPKGTIFDRYLGPVIAQDVMTGIAMCIDPRVRTPWPPLNSQYGYVVAIRREPYGLCARRSGARRVSDEWS